MTQVDRAQVAMADGVRLLETGDLDGAEAAFRAATQFAPLAPGPMHNLGTVFHLRGDLAAAEEAFRRALALEPGRAVTRYSLGVSLLTQGRFAEGFPYYDARRELPGQRDVFGGKAPFPLWRGEDPNGRRLLLVSDEGLGDQIMYARFARDLQEHGAEVEWLCPPPLVRLFRESLGVPATPLGATVEVRPADFWCPPGSLPVGYFTSATTLPSAPYLTPPQPTRITGARIGVAWRGNPKHENDEHRSLPPTEASKLLAMPGAVSLHPEDTGARDLFDTAAIMAGLDLVISVDSSPANLAGALGLPTWVLLPAHKTDWRWMTDRSDSPWYPSATLYRQARPGDWSEVIERVQHDVANQSRA